MIWDVPDLQLMQDVLGHLIPLPLTKRVYFAHGPRVRAFSLAELLNKPAQLYLQPANPFVVRPGQLDVALRVGQRRVAQPLL